MKQLLTILMGTIMFLSASLLQAFSPYENFLGTDSPKQVGLIAKLPPGHSDAFREAVRQLDAPDGREDLAKSGISNLSAFTRTIGDTTWAVVHFVLDGQRDYLGAARLFEAASCSGGTLTSLVEPHPRATRLGTTWLQMEWINYIRGKDLDGPAKNDLMIVTTVLPEKEAEYRSLHQTVWPGVVDQLVRSWNRDLCIFLVEIDDLLVEFLYVEYIGQDQEKDDAMSQSDVINHRWWKLTDACQKGLPGIEGNWVEMTQIK